MQSREALTRKQGYASVTSLQNFQTLENGAIQFRDELLQGNPRPLSSLEKCSGGTRRVNSRRVKVLEGLAPDLASTLLAPLADVVRNAHCIGRLCSHNGHIRDTVALEGRQEFPLVMWGQGGYGQPQRIQDFIDVSIILILLLLLNLCLQQVIRCLSEGRVVLGGGNPPCQTPGGSLSFPDR